MEHKKMFRGVVPASPNYFIIDVFEEDGFTAPIWKIPIVAWEIMEDGGNSVALPIGLETQIGRTTVYILTPELTVYEPESRSWDNVDNFIRDRRKDISK